MVSPKKIQTVQVLTEKLKRAKSLVLVDYSGLSAPQQHRLREKIKEAGGEFNVTKNTLLGLAIKNITGLPRVRQLADLRGPTATLFAYEDEIAPIKALIEFSKEFALPKIKIGLFEGKTMEREKIEELAEIPGKNELLAKLILTLNSPLRGLAQVLSADTRKLIFVLGRKGGEN